MRSDIRLKDLGAMPQAPVLFVVEHDEVVRSALTFILCEAYDTQACASLDELGAAVAARSPDLILVGDGLIEGAPRHELADLQVAELANTKLLLLQNRTGDPEQGAATHCPPFGRNADGILRKPITVDNVRNTVAALLGEAET